MSAYSHLAAALTASFLVLLIDILPNAPLFSYGAIVVVVFVFSVTYFLSIGSAFVLNPLFRIRSSFVSGLSFAATGLFWGTLLNVFSRQGYFNQPGKMWQDISNDFLHFLSLNWEFPAIGMVSALAAWIVSRRSNRARGA